MSEQENRPEESQPQESQPPESPAVEAPAAAAAEAADASPNASPGAPVAEATETQKDPGSSHGSSPDRGKKKRARRRKRGGEVKAGGARSAAKGETRPARGGSERRSPNELVRRAFEDLASAFLDLRKRAGGSAPRGAESQPELELELKIPLRRRDVQAAADAYVRKLRESLEKSVLEQGLLVPGRTWCFNTASFDSDYSRPDDPRQVLVGYGLEGRPRFADLVTLAIERKHECVDALLAGKEGAVHFLEKGSDVTSGIEPAFDPKAAPFRLVAQTMAGLYASSEEGRRVALTIQVLEHQDGDNKKRLLVHPVCAVDLLDLPELGVVRSLRRFQDELDALQRANLGKDAASESYDLEEQCVGLLRDLMRRFSSSTKNRERKTDHARDREAGGQRPTQLAFPEARSARDHHLFVDNEEQTMVVIGKKGRIHVFSLDGRHVTSVIMPPSNVRQRQKAGRWRPAEAEERGTFRAAVAEGGAQETTTEA